MTSLLTRLKRTEDPLLRQALLRGRGMLHYAARGHAVRSRAVEAYLASARDPKLHIGAGPYRFDSWLNTDLIAGDAYVDLNRRLPFRDGSFAFAFGEHVIEHLSEGSGAGLMKELRRVLLPGGVLRLTTPDLLKLLAIYEDRNPVVSRAEYACFLDEQTGKRHERPCQILNDYLRLWGHQWIYDEDDLTARLLGAGFARVQRVEPGQSEHAELRGLERHGGAEWVNRAEAMCLEAMCPP